MRYIHLTLFVIIAPFIFSFSFLKFIKTRDHEAIANEIMAKVAKKLTKRHQMDWIGEGGGMMGSVYMLGLSFQINHSMNRDEARARIVDCVEELLSAVNENEEIRPFLKNYPFTTKNVQISIFITHPNGNEVFDPSICTVSIFESDQITFSTIEPNKFTYKNRYRESYSEALAKLRQNQKQEASIQPHQTLNHPIY